MSEKDIDVGFLYRYANQVCVLIGPRTEAHSDACGLQYPKAIRLVSRGIIELMPLITHKFHLEDAITAFHTAADPVRGAIKVLIID
jgi:L-iditol 2-dehydrogenase